MSVPFTEEERAEIEARLGYSFRTQGLLDQAFTHVSFAHEVAARNHPPPPHYDRLEFLGDAAIGLILAEHEMRDMPEGGSGELSQRRARLARRGSLVGAAQRLGLGQYARLSSGERLQGGPSRGRLLADLFEAIAGAIYLDGGFEAARSFVHRTLIAEAGRSPAPREDFKSALQEILQGAGGSAPSYRVTETSGPAHSPMFLVEVEIEGCVAGRGGGGSKREAEQAAAHDALLSRTISRTGAREKTP